MRIEEIKVVYDNPSTYTRIIKINSCGKASMSIHSTELTSIASVSLSVSNYPDIFKAATYSIKPTVSTYNAGDHLSLTNLDSTYLILQADFLSSTAGNILITLVFEENQNFFLSNSLGTNNNPSIISYGDSMSVDSFGRLRTSEPANRLDAEFNYDKLEEIFDEVTNGAGTVTHDANARHLLLEANGTGVGDNAAIYSYPVPYTPGCSQLIELTGVLDYAAIGGGTAQLFLRSNVTGVVTEEVYDQEDWDNPCVDKDWSFSQIFVMDFQSLKVGRIRFGLNESGINIPIHEIKNNNKRNTGYWQTPNLSDYYRIYNDATYTYMELGYGDDDNAIGFRYRITANAAAQMTAICCTVKSEGGKDLFDMSRYPQSADMGVTPKTVSTSIIPLLSIRQRSTFNSIANNSIALPEFLSVQTNNPIRLIIYHDCTLTGAVWGNVDTTHSTMEYNTTASALANGHIIVSEYVATSKNINTSANALLGKAVLWHRKNGNSGILTIAAVRSDSTNASVLCSIKWGEIR